MAPITAFGLLALASAALAVPHVGHNHQHLHNRAAAAAADSSSTSSTSSDSLSHFTAPACWSTCFAKYNPKSEGTLCTSSVASSMRSCIETSCKNTAGAVKRYDAWADSYCSSAASYGATGTGTGTGAAGPTSTSGAITTTTVCTETDTYTYLTTTLYSTYVVTSTITIETDVPTTTAATSASSGASVSALSTGTTESVCPVVTVTTKIYETVTVTAGDVTSSSSSSASKVSAAQVSASSEPTTTATSASSVSTTTATSASSTSASTSEAAAYVASYGSSSSSASSVSSASSEESSSSASSSSAAASSSTTATASSAGFSKRGLAYNDATDCDAFYSSGIMGWAYNWGSLPEGLSTSEVTYIPMLWSSDSTFTSYWETNAPVCISEYNATYFFSFNEPDMTSQADMSPAEAAAAWLTYMEPYAGQVKLVAPAVTNGVGTGLGLDWLTEFISECSTCTIDAVNQHWYDSTSNDVALFKQQIQDTITTTGKPIFVTEFAGIGSDSELVSFMDEVMDWMDSNDDVLGYSYYMVGDGYMNDGTGLSALGEAYCGDSSS